MTVSRIRALVVALVLLLVQHPVDASVMPIRFSALVTRSHVIVLGRVAEVVDLDGVRIARVEVIENYKGDPGKELHFFASPTWTCDITGADEGETTLLFLDPFNYQNLGKAARDLKPRIDKVTGGGPLMGVAHSGRGSMTVRTVAGVEYATLWTSEVILPEDVETIDGPEAEFADFIRSARLDRLGSLIAEAMDTSPR